MLAPISSQSVGAGGQVLDVGEGSGLGRRYRSIDFVPAFPRHALDLIHRAEPVGAKPLACTRDGTASDPLVDLGLRPVSLVIVPKRTDVLSPAIRDALEERRSVAAPGSLDGLPGRGEDGEHVVAVDTGRRHAVRAGSHMDR